TRARCAFWFGPGLTSTTPQATASTTRARIQRRVLTTPFCRTERHFPGLDSIGAVRGVLVVCLVVLALGAASAHAGSRDVQHVTLIGDSVADAIGNTNSAVGIVKQGVDLDFEVAPCRRVEGEGCPVDGVRPPSVVQLAKAMGPK